MCNNNNISMYKNNIYLHVYNNNNISMYDNNNIYLMFDIGKVPSHQISRLQTLCTT